MPATGNNHYKGETTIPSDAKIGVWKSIISVVGEGAVNLVQRMALTLLSALRYQETHDLSITTFSLRQIR